MPGTTTTHELPYPLPGDPVGQGDDTIRALAEAVDDYLVYVNAVSGLTGEDDAVALLATEETSALYAALVAGFARGQVVTHPRWGAVGDEVADDQAAIQACGDWVGANGGGTVFIPFGAHQGRYRMDDRLELPSNVEWVAEKGATLVFTYTETSPTGKAQYLRNDDVPGGNTGIVLRGLAVEGAHDGTPWGVATSPGVGLNLRNCTDVRVEGCTFQFMPGPSITFQGVTRGTFRGNTVRDGGRGGIIGWGVADRPTSDISITDNRIYNVGDDAISVQANAAGGGALQRPTGITITGNTIRHNETVYPESGGRGIMLMGCEDTTVTGNTIRDTFASGLMIDWDDEGAESWSCVDITATGNTFRDCGNAGVDIRGSEHVTITGNTIKGCTQDGVYAEDSSHLTITGNDIHDNGTTLTLHHGINLAGATTAMEVHHVTIGDNDISRNAGAGVRVKNADRVKVTDNDITDNGNAGDGTDAIGSGVYLDTPGTARVSGNDITDTRATGKTQTRGIRVHSSVAMASLRLADNGLLGNALTAISLGLAPTVLVKRGNVESTQAASNYDQDASGAQRRSGVGTPEAAVTAPVGSIYTRTNGAAATTLYIKETGTGNTGWAAK